MSDMRLFLSKRMDCIDNAAINKASHICADKP